MRQRLARLAVEIGWNQRVFTEPDLFSLCEQEQIRVIVCPQPVSGCYLHYRGLQIIGLHSGLRGVSRTRVFAHELGHHYLHSPGMWFFWSGNEIKKQFQAQTFAACCLIPRWQIDHLTPAELQEAYNLPPDLIAFRLRLRNDYGY